MKNKVILTGAVLFWGLAIYLFFQKYQFNFTPYQGDRAPKILVPLKPYENKENGFVISFPGHWRLTENGVHGETVTAMNSISDFKNLLYSYTSNINVGILPMEGKSHEEFSQKISQDKSNYHRIKNYQVVKKNNVLMGGQEAVLMTSTFEFEQPSNLFVPMHGSYSLKNMTMIVSKKDIAYIVSATSLVNAWGRYEDIFEQAMMSFKYLP